MEIVYLFVDNSTMNASSSDPEEQTGAAELDAVSTNEKSRTLKRLRDQAEEFAEGILPLLPTNDQSDPAWNQEVLCRRAENFSRRVNSTIGRPARPPVGAPTGGSYLDRWSGFPQPTAKLIAYSFET